MENERRNSHNILLTVIAAATLIVAMIGATFAYFSATSTADKQQITTGELKIAASSTEITQQEIKPTKWNGDDTSEIGDDNRGDIAELTLTVNTGGTTIDGATYDIYLTTTGINLNTTGKDSDNNTLVGGKLKDVKWALFDDDHDNFIGSGDFTSNTGDEGTDGNVENKKINNNPIEITANDNQNHTYKLYIWIQDDDTPQNQLQDLTIGATLKVEAKQSVITD